MSLNVTTLAQRSNVKPMRLAVSQMVMVLFCWFAAITAWQCFWPSHSTTFDLIAYSTGRLGLRPGGWRLILAFFPNFDTPTINARRSKPVASALVRIKLTALPPRSTAITPLEAMRNVIEIYLKGNTYSTGCDFLTANLRTHCILLNRVGTIIPQQ